MDREYVKATNAQRRQRSTPRLEFPAQMKDSLVVPGQWPKLWGSVNGILEVVERGRQAQFELDTSCVSNI